MGRNKAAIDLAGLSMLLVAAVVGVESTGLGAGSRFHAEFHAGAHHSHSFSLTKSAATICDQVDFKDTCKKNFEGAKANDPKELIQMSFNFGVSTIEDVISKSKTIQDAAKDPRASQALDVCKEVLHDAIYDFNRSIVKVSNLEVKHLSGFLADLKTWISATITVQETCLDAFQNTTGDAGERMKLLLKTAGEISSNALAIVSDISRLFSGFNIPGFGTHSRSLEEDNEPDFVTASARTLMQASPASLRPNAVVAQDGSGQFKSIMAAVNTVPKTNAQPFVIHIKAGVYRENVMLPKHVDHIVLVGDGPLKTKITGNKNFIDGVTTYQTATLSVNGDNCILRDLGIENSAGPEKHQAVALRVSGDMAIIYNCQLDGYQDTLYTHSYRQYYRDTTVSGTIDFIFGDAQAVFQNCRLMVRKPMENQGCMVTAQGRKTSRGMGGIILQNCTILAARAFMATRPRPKAYLGRPWKEFSRTIIMQSFIDGFIVPEGWSEWMGDFALNTLYYGEYQNRGPGADTSRRVKWRGIQRITPQIAQSFTPGPYIQGDSWITPAGVPYSSGMINV